MYRIYVHMECNGEEWTCVGLWREERNAFRTTNGRPQHDRIATFPEHPYTLLRNTISFVCSLVRFRDYTMVCDTVQLACAYKRDTVLKTTHGGVE